MTPNPTTDWIDAAKSKPDSGRIVEVRHIDSPEPMRAKYSDYFGVWIRSGADPIRIPVTHWRDFPDPPK